MSTDLHTLSRALERAEYETRRAKSEIQSLERTIRHLIVALLVTLGYAVRSLWPRWDLIVFMALFIAGFIVLVEIGCGEQKGRGRVRGK